MYNHLYHTMPKSIISFENFTLGYQQHPAVHHLNGTVQSGTLTAIVGANGSGKSTLMKGIVGMLKPMTGSCIVAPNIQLAYLPQQSELDRHFPANVWDLVSLGLWSKRGLLQIHSHKDHKIIAQAIESVGLLGLEKRPIDTLSGGQLQRALFARVLVQNADLILLDEPFNAIDSNTLSVLLTLIKQWQTDGRTIMVVVHDLDLVRKHFPQTMLLARELIAWDCTTCALTTTNLQRASELHQSWDNEASWCDINNLISESNTTYKAATSHNA